MPVEAILRRVLTNPTYLGAWVFLVAVSLATLVWDVHERNSEIAPLMKLV